MGWVGFGGFVVLWPKPNLTLYKFFFVTQPNPTHQILKTDPTQWVRLSGSVGFLHTPTFSSLFSPLSVSSNLFFNSKHPKHCIQNTGFKIASENCSSLSPKPNSENQSQSQCQPPFSFSSLFSISPLKFLTIFYESMPLHHDLLEVTPNPAHKWIRSKSCPTQPIESDPIGPSYSPSI